MTDIINENTDIINNDSNAPEGNEPERVVIFEEALEAILFAAGHPITYSTLGRVFNMTPAKIKDKVFEYSLKYNDPSIPRGVILLTYSDSCQLCTKQYYLTEIRDALGIKKSGTLSTSSMEALAIIAYNQPVTRVFVDTLRRADSSYAMNNLLDRGLIESKGRMDAPGRPMLYGTTSDFLRCFGLRDLDSLPGTSDELMEVFNKTKLTDSDNEEKNENADALAEDQIKMEISENGDISDKNDADSIADEDFEPSADDDIVEDDSIADDGDASDDEE